MYRYEFDTRRKILVLTLHGMQDAWEAKLMHLEWPQHKETLASDWSLIIDVKDYHGAPPAARKEQGKLADLLAAQPFKKIFVISATEPEASKLVLEGLSYEVRDEFHLAYKEVGGEDRTVTVQPPAQGHYPANNPPPAQ